MNRAAMWLGYAVAAFTAYAVARHAWDIGKLAIR